MFFGSVLITFLLIFDCLILMISEKLILKLAVSSCSGHGIFHHFQQYSHNCDVFVYQLTCGSPIEQLEFISASVMFLGLGSLTLYIMSGSGKASIK